MQVRGWVGRTEMLAPTSISARLPDPKNCLRNLVQIRIAIVELSGNFMKSALHMGVGSFVRTTQNAQFPAKPWSPALLLMMSVEPFICSSCFFLKSVKSLVTVSRDAPIIWAISS